MPGRFPRAAAFLQDPEPGDVLEKADGAAEADFVGEAGFARGVGDDGRGKFRAEQRPGAGAEIGPVVAPGGNGGDGRAGVVRAGGDDLRLRRGRGVLASCSMTGPRTVPLGTIRGKSDFLTAERRDDFLRPGLGAWIVKLRGAGQRLLGRFDAGELRVEVVGDVEEVVGAGEDGPGLRAAALRGDRSY